MGRASKTSLQGPRQSIFQQKRKKKLKNRACFDYHFNARSNHPDTHTYTHQSPVKIETPRASSHPLSAAGMPWWRAWPLSSALRFVLLKTRRPSSDLPCSKADFAAERSKVDVAQFCLRGGLHLSHAEQAGGKAGTQGDHVYLVKVFVTGFRRSFRSSNSHSWVGFSLALFPGMYGR